MGENVYDAFVRNHVGRVLSELGDESFSDGIYALPPALAKRPGALSLNNRKGQRGGKSEDVAAMQRSEDISQLYQPQYDRLWRSHPAEVAVEPVFPYALPDRMRNQTQGRVSRPPAPLLRLEPETDLWMTLERRQNAPRPVPRFGQTELTDEEKRQAQWWLNCGGLDRSDRSMEFVDRNAWSSDKNPKYGDMTPQKDGYNTITFHHTGFNKSPEGVEGLHTNVNPSGWAQNGYRYARNVLSGGKAQKYGRFSDIGYHFLIDEQGKVFQGRSSMYVGEHVKNHNTGNLGIAFLGDYSKSRLTEAQLQAASNLVNVVKDRYSIKRIATHGEFDAARKNELRGAFAQLQCLAR